MKKLRIELWSDFCSPHCYLAERRLERAIEALHCQDFVRMEVHSFELEPEAGPSEPVLFAIMRKQALSEAAAREVVAALVQDAAGDGVAMAGYEKAMLANTFDAHRLAKYAWSLGTDLREALFAAHLRGGIDLADRASLVQLASSAGLDAGDVERMLASPAFADDVRADERIAEAYRVQSAPSFLFSDNYLMEGALPYEKVESGLRTILARERIKPEEKSGCPTCGPNGCGIG